MKKKQRSPGQTAVSLSIEEQLLQRIDERAALLGMNRSMYLAALARKDISEGGPVLLHELPPPPYKTTGRK
jgi:predicted DNA binding CopG/RHH family protein